MIAKCSATQKLDFLRNRQLPIDVFPVYDDPPGPTFRKNLHAVRQVTYVQNPRFFPDFNKKFRIDNKVDIWYSGMLAKL